MSKTLCDWSKRDLQEHPDRLARIVKDPRFYCRRCARVAHSPKVLCKPRELPLCGDDRSDVSENAS